MTTLDGFLVASLVIAAFQLAMTIANLRLYRPSDPAHPHAPGPRITVCIPARNEESNLAPCVQGLLASTAAIVEILVYDDHSTDATANLLAQLCTADPRVRAVETATLPPGWNGKQFACARMAAAATGDWVLFTDADVRFEPDALARTLAEALRRDVGLLSTFPRQRCGTVAELTIVPMIFFVLFSYLPFARMRRTLDPAASAGCGQFLFVRRDAYAASGGHATFPASMHDGIMLPRAIRKAGFRTDLFDGSDLASCRMYRGFRQTWRGFAKNAYEGLGSFPILLLFSTLHAIGHVLPWLALGVTLASAQLHTPAVLLAALAIALAIVQRALLARRMKLPVLSALLHPIGIIAMTAIQWHSFALHVTGRRTWRGRSLTAPVT